VALLSSDARHRVVKNLHLIRGPAPKWRDALDTMDTFANFAGAFAESLASGSKNERPIDAVVEGRDHLQAVLGGPFIIGTIHSGGWDVFGSLLVRDFALDVVIAMARETDPEAQRLHDRARSRMRVRIEHVGDDPLDALPLFHQLRRGGVVAMQLDRASPGMRTVPVRLLGEAATIPEGPFQLARLARVPLVPVFCARTGFRRYRIVIHPAVRIERRASADAIAEAAGDVADRMTAFIREHPAQWFNF
jgi:lauroyl/myristoyl acyltransferase